MPKDKKHKSTIYEYGSHTSQYASRTGKMYQSRYYTDKNGVKIMRVPPKFDIKRAGKTKDLEPILECGGQIPRKKTGRAKSRITYNKMIQKNGLFELNRQLKAPKVSSDLTSVSVNDYYDRYL